MKNILNNSLHKAIYFIAENCQKEHDFEVYKQSIDYTKLIIKIFIRSQLMIDAALKTRENEFERQYEYCMPFFGNQIEKIVYVSDSLAHDVIDDLLLLANNNK